MSATTAVFLSLLVFAAVEAKPDADGGYHAPGIGAGGFGLLDGAGGHGIGGGVLPGVGGLVDLGHGGGGIGGGGFGGAGFGGAGFGGAGGDLDLALGASFGGGAVVAAAGPAAGYGAPPPAYGCETHYVTKYLNKIKEVPVHHTVFRTQLLPTEVYEPKFEQVYKTVIKNQFLPKYVTTTVYVDQVAYATDYKHVTETVYKDVLVTQTQVVPTYVTQTEFSTVFRKRTNFQTRVETQINPAYVTTTQVVVQTKYSTNIVPEYSTVYKTVHDVKTVCPKPAYGY